MHKTLAMLALLMSSSALAVNAASITLISDTVDVSTAVLTPQTDGTALVQAAGSGGVLFRLFTDPGELVRLTFVSTISVFGNNGAIQGVQTFDHLLVLVPGSDPFVNFSTDLATGLGVLPQGNYTASYNLRVLGTPLPFFATVANPINITRTFNFSVASIPEPSPLLPLVTLGLLASGIALRRRFAT